MKQLPTAAGSQHKQEELRDSFPLSAAGSCHSHNGNRFHPSLFPDVLKSYRYTFLLHLKYSDPQIRRSEGRGPVSLWPTEHTCSGLCDF